MSQFKNKSSSEMTASRSTWLRTLGVGAGLLILTGCAGVTEDSYKGYPGETAPDAKLATVRNQLPNQWNSAFFKEAPFFEVNGTQLGAHPEKGKRYTTVKLAPGTHTVKYNVVFNVSSMIEPSGHASFLGTAENIDLKAGHTYDLRATRSIGPGYSVEMRIWDETEDRDAFPGVVRVTRRQ